MSYQQFTTAQLRTYFYQQVGGNTAFWRTDEVDRILRESFRIFNVLTGFWRDRVTVVGGTVASQVWYTVPTGLSYILRVEVNGHPLGSSSLWDLDYGQPTWESEVCTSGDLPQVFAPAGTNLFALWPASLGGGESLIVEGVIPAPDPVTAPFVNLGQDELDAILDYAEHIAQFKEGGEEFDASQVSLQDFLKEAGSRNAVLMRSSKFRSWMGLTDQPKRPIRQTPERVGAR
jgi:hypothetical protein